ncbi:MAG: sulfide/dihydroorotate dehydrogenase-like FAD/NAD-binding protein [Fibromonadaceae bacterium]|jgi:ferredoxin--NADP+ reductase|nr:sulfide/dihydroorotate dehydrogenase-like FAD/NAD-binding protein [Fibromonadaceae bacterium]
MAKILEKEQLSDDVYRFVVEAPLIAEERLAGQFIILQTDLEKGERIPLTIADANKEQGSITLIFQTVGKSTIDLAQFKVGDSIPVLTGPLGSPTHIENFGHAVCVCGGIGAAPTYPIAQALKKAGNKVTVILGARRRDLIVMEKELRSVADEMIICTDDGSYGRKCLVTEPLKELCENEKPNFATTIGPPIMMKFCAETTRPYGVKTFASLNSIMVDGTGMCGCCRVTVGGEVKFVCVDGPEFDAHLVDWDNMLKRMGTYKQREALAKERALEKLKGGSCECGSSK